MSQPILPPLSGTAEILPSFQPRPQISHVVLDFDGTLSWIRHGWPRIMRDLFEEHFPRFPEESDQEVAHILQNIILGMNGRPTIMQMIRFAELVKERGGPDLSPEDLRATYQSRLDTEIERRAACIASGEATMDDFVLFNARPFLQFLRGAGIVPIVLSSTVEERVREEAGILGLTEYFGHRINGSTGDPTKFSKKAVLQRILRDEAITGDRLLSIGDGPVELAGAKELGALAIGVCSDEDHNGSGVMDPFKFEQLKAAGADALVADFRDAVALMKYLLKK